MRFKRENSVLYVVDVQEKLTPLVENSAILIQQCRRLIQAAQILDIPVFWIEQYPKGLGATVSELREVLEGLHPIEKRCFSAVCEDAEHAFEGLGRDQIVVCGIEAHVCVLQTVLDHLEKEREVMVVADAVSSRKNLDRETALLRMKSEGALLSTVESILFEWLKTSEAEEFRAVQALIK